MVPGTGEGDYARLGLAMAQPLGRTTEFLSDALDDLQACVTAQPKRVSV